MCRRIAWGVLLGFLLACYTGCGGSEPVNHPEELPDARIPKLPKKK